MVRRRVICLFILLSKPRLALLAQGDHLLEKKRGWVSIADVADIRKPRVLQSLEFDNNIYSVAVNRRVAHIFKGLQQVFPQLEVRKQSSSFAKEGDEIPLAKAAPKKPSKEQLQTLLQKAVDEKDLQQMKALCEQGADSNSPGHEKSSPVERSVESDNWEALQILLENGGKANNRDGHVMISAALNEEFEAMKLLQQYGGNIAQTDSDGCTTLHYLAAGGTLEMVQYLVDNGVPVEAKCRKGETALDWARQKNDEPVIRYLTDLQSKSSQAKSP